MSREDSISYQELVLVIVTPLISGLTYYRDNVVQLVVQSRWPAAKKKKAWIHFRRGASSIFLFRHRALFLSQSGHRCVTFLSC